jgi:hypothetical protein
MCDDVQYVPVCPTDVNRNLYFYNVCLFRAQKSVADVQHSRLAIVHQELKSPNVAPSAAAFFLTVEDGVSSAERFLSIK